MDWQAVAAIVSGVCSMLGACWILATTLARHAERIAVIEAKLSNGM